MPKRNREQAIVAEITELLGDTDKSLVIGNSKMGGTDELEPELALAIIRNLVNGTEDDLTRDYRATKAAQLVTLRGPG